MRHPFFDRIIATSGHWISMWLSPRMALVVAGMCVGLLRSIAAVSHIFTHHIIHKMNAALGQLTRVKHACYSLAYVLPPTVTLLIHLTHERVSVG